MSVLSSAYMKIERGQQFLVFCMDRQWLELLHSQRSEWESRYYQCLEENGHFGGGVGATLLAEYAIQVVELNKRIAELEKQIYAPDISPG